MKQKLKTNKGITLIALIVTIIVLLILATVTIKLLIDNGIVGRSKGATNKFLVASEKEKIKLGYTDYKMARFDVEADPVELDLLERYFNAIDLRNLFDDKLKFKDEENTIPDASKSMQLLGYGNLGDDYEFYSFIYKSNQYELHVKYLGCEGYTFEGVKAVGTTELKIQDANVVGNILRGWDIKFKSGNTYKLKVDGTIELVKEKTDDEKLLEKYFFGEEGKIVSFMEFMGEDGLIGNDIIPNASEEIKIGGGYYEIENDTYYMYYMYYLITYKNKGYAIKLNEMLTILSLDLVYEPKGKEGQTIPYSIDGTPENEKDWTVLYDYGNGVVEIVSPDVMGSLTLGYNDEEAQTPGDVDKDGTANTNIDKAIYSYNNAVSRINKYASSFVTNTNKISVRSVGSNPNNSEAENSTMHKSEKLSKWCEGKYNGLGKETDDNYKEDFIRIGTLGIAATGDYYWLASRFVYEFSFNSDVNFDVVSVENSGWIGSNYGLWHVYENYVSVGSNTYGVRPVVKINLPN